MKKYISKIDYTEAGLVKNPKNIGYKHNLDLAKNNLIFYSTDVVKKEHIKNIFTLKKYNKIDNFIYTNHIAGLTNESILKTYNFVLNKFRSIYEKL